MLFLCAVSLIVLYTFIQGVLLLFGVFTVEIMAAGVLLSFKYDSFLPNIFLAPNTAHELHPCAPEHFVFSPI